MARKKPVLLGTQDDNSLGFYKGNKNQSEVNRFLKLYCEKFGLTVKRWERKEIQASYPAWENVVYFNETIPESLADEAMEFAEDYEQGKI
jgi:hypothetical protein